MHAEKIWNHDAFFAYVDRWMTEDDKPFRDEIFKKTGDQNNDLKRHQGLVPRRLHRRWLGQNRLEQYRTAPGMPPTDGWKTLKANPNGLVLPSVEPAAGQ